MNFQQKNEERKRIKGLFLASYPEGCIKWSNESFEHFNIKSQVFYWLKINGYEVWSEPVLKGINQRPDLLCLHNNGTSAYIIEIVKSESESSIKKKQDTYPLPIIVVNASSFKYSEFCL